MTRIESTTINKKTLTLVIAALTIVGAFALTMGFASSSDSKPEISATPGFIVTAEKNSNTYGIIKVTNTSDTNDVLLSAATDSAKTELHVLKNDKMQKVDSLPIPANSEVLFTGNPHLMFINLEKDFELGDTVKIVLDFKNSDNVSLEIPVTQSDGHSHEH